MSYAYICEVVPVFVRPQSMTDEQACFGIIVRCPEAKFLSYRLAADDEPVIARISNFFPDFGRANLERVMTWAANDIEFAFAAERKNGGEEAFANLIRPRENVIRYGAPQVVMTDDLVRETNDLYVRAVQRKIRNNSI